MASPPPSYLGAPPKGSGRLWPTGPVGWRGFSKQPRSATLRN